MNSLLDAPNPTPRNFSTTEKLVALVVIVVSALMIYWYANSRTHARHLAVESDKLRELHEAMMGYISDHAGLLPIVESSEGNGWASAARPEAKEMWYNGLPPYLGSKGVGEIGATDPRKFYEDSHPLSLEGANYPKGEAKLARPFFAFAMNGKLQSDDQDGNRIPIPLISIQVPLNTVAFLSRGLPDEKMRSRHQEGFDGGPSAGPRSFATRYRRKGVLMFVDGHVEVRAFDELVDETGTVIRRDAIIWTQNPDDDPN